MIDRSKQFRAIQDEALELFKRKNADYGDSFTKHGPTGIIIRLGDKLHRLQSITRTGVTLVNTETLRDTLIDMHSYAAMAVMLLDEGGDEKSDDAPMDAAEVTPGPDEGGGEVLVDGDVLLRSMRRSVRIMESTGPGNEKGGPVERARAKLAELRELRGQDGTRRTAKKNST